MCNPNYMIFMVLLLSPYFMGECRSDPAEGTRLLEEAFRDYDKRIRPNYGGDAVTVNVSMHILSISEVNAQDMTYTMTFYIRQLWTDPRLSFNSRRNIDTLTLDAATSERIWIPDTFFVNEISSITHNDLVKNQFCRIAQDGLVLFSKRVTLTAFSAMSSVKFPYDSPTLHLDLESYGSLMKDLRYQWATEDISTSDYFAPGFIMKSLTASGSSKLTSTGAYSLLAVDIEMKRDPLAYELGFMLTTFLVTLSSLGSTSTRVNRKHGLVASIILMFLMVILYAMLSLVGYNNFGIGHSITVLHVYLMLSGIFCCVSLVVNLRRKHYSASSNKVNKPGDDTFERKSPTESASDNCKAEETVGESESQEQPANDEEKAWATVIRNVKRKPRLELSLWISFIGMNILFILLGRVLQ